MPTILPGVDVITPSPSLLILSVFLFLNIGAKVEIYVRLFRGSLGTLSTAKAADRSGLLKGSLGTLRTAKAVGSSGLVAKCVLDGDRAASLSFVGSIWLPVLMFEMADSLVLAKAAGNGEAVAKCVIDGDWGTLFK